MTDKPSRDLVLIWGLTALAFYVWLRMFSQLPLIRQIVFLSIAIAIQLGIYQMVRLEGFAGDGRPLWSWRWTPTPQEHFEESRVVKDSVRNSKNIVADLQSTTEWDSPAFRGADRTGRFLFNER